ncbi:MAG TPA: fibronectin type III domain-containing protein [Kofleriaceae bacterium]|jgi:hypothetical protein
MLRSLAAALVLVAAAASARADTGRCRVVQADFEPGQPSARYQPQIVVWLEKPDGTYVDTLFITQKTGRYGMGNRPGRFDFNSGPSWPYGRRITTFPVWAARHGIAFEEIIFQNREDDDLSHPVSDSSAETFFCRPMISSDTGWDAQTCATPHVFTDKGVFGSGTVGYPPRSDISSQTGDSQSVSGYRALNPFDAVSAATPPANQPAELSWPVPPELADGDYVLWLEISSEHDFNDTYNSTLYPPPEDIAFGNYGEAYRGQPSILYSVPFSVADGTTTATTDTYVGYGDPAGGDGDIRPPDSTITSDTPGSGAQRLLLLNGHRITVTQHTEDDSTPPAAATSPEVDTSTVQPTLTFTAPGDDGTLGTVTGYDVRIVFGGAMDESAFTAASPVMATFDSIAAGGSTQTVALAGLLPETEYTLGIRATDDCGNVGPLATVTFTTQARQSGEVDACFIATAAYGSILANDVERLRHFRDAFLEHSAMGELAVASYYTFGPALAGVVGESDLLRATARAALAPVVAGVRRAKVTP